MGQVSALGAGGAAIARPRRSWIALAAPGVVGVVMLALLAASAGGAWRPAREVRVVQAVPLVGAPGATPVQPEAAHAGHEHGAQPRVRGSAVQAAGWLEADPYVVAAAGLADGVIREVLVLEGDRVEAGQVIARLVSDDAALALRGAEAEAAVAESALEAARADAAAAETDWEEPVERDLAVALASAAVARARGELAQWPAMVAADRARLEESQQRLERVRQALSGGGSNEIEVITLEKATDALAAALAATEQREAILLADLARAEGELSAAERGAALRVRERRELGSRRAALAEAEAALRLAEVRRDEASLRLSRMEVEAPISGVVQRRYAAPGQRIMLSSDDPTAAIVATLYDPARLQVRVDVPLADAGGIVVGQACEVSVEILPGRTLRGVVTRIGHEADIQKNTLEVKVRVIDPPAVLRPEMLTRVKFLAGEVAGDDVEPTAGAGGGTPSRTEAAPAAARAEDRQGGGRVLVPAEAIDGEGSAARVWTVRDRRGDRGVARPEPVEVIGERDGLVIVRSGIRPGEVLVAGPRDLRDGMAVRTRFDRGITESAGAQP